MAALVQARHHRQCTVIHFVSLKVMLAMLVPPYEQKHEQKLFWHVAPAMHVLGDAN